MLCFCLICHCYNGDEKKVTQLMRQLFCWQEHNAIFENMLQDAAKRATNDNKAANNKPLDDEQAENANKAEDDDESFNASKGAGCIENI
jgi:hypothetical protein